MSAAGGTGALEPGRGLGLFPTFVGGGKLVTTLFTPGACTGVWPQAPADAGAPSSRDTFRESSSIALEEPFAVAARPSSTALTLAKSTSSDAGFARRCSRDASSFCMRAVTSLRLASTALVPPAAAAPGVFAIASRSSCIWRWSSGTAAASFCTCAASRSTLESAAVAASAVALRWENAVASAFTFSCRCVIAAAAATSPPVAPADAAALASAFSSAAARLASAEASPSLANTPVAVWFSVLSSSRILESIALETVSCALSPSRALCASFSALRVLWYAASSCWRFFCSSARELIRLLNLRQELALALRARRELGLLALHGAGGRAARLRRPSPIALSKPGDLCIAASRRRRTDGGSGGAIVAVAVAVAAAAAAAAGPFPRPALARLGICAEAPRPRTASDAPNSGTAAGPARTRESNPAASPPPPRAPVAVGRHGRRRARGEASPRRCSAEPGGHGTRGPSTSRAVARVARGVQRSHAVAVRAVAAHAVEVLAPAAVAARRGGGGRLRRRAGGGPTAVPGAGRRRRGGRRRGRRDAVGVERGPSRRERGVIPSRVRRYVLQRGGVRVPASAVAGAHRPARRHVQTRRRRRRVPAVQRQVVVPLGRAASGANQPGSADRIAWCAGGGSRGGSSWKYPSSS